MCEILNAFRKLMCSAENTYFLSWSDILNATQNMMDDVYMFEQAPYSWKYISPFFNRLYIPGEKYKYAKKYYFSNFIFRIYGHDIITFLFCSRPLWKKSKKKNILRKQQTFFQRRMNIFHHFIEQTNMHILRLTDWQTLGEIFRGYIFFKQTPSKKRV